MKCALFIVHLSCYDCYVVLHSRVEDKKFM